MSRRYDWVVGWWSERQKGSGATCSSHLQTFSINDQQMSIIQLLNDADLAEHTDDVLVERVVGQYMLAFAPDLSDEEHTSCGVHMRLTTRPEDADTGAVFAARISPYKNADEKFMWHKVHILGEGAPALYPQHHPEWSHIDVKVNRRVEELERLVLLVEPFPIVGVEAGDECSIHVAIRMAAWLRVLVSSRG